LPIGARLFEPGLGGLDCGRDRLSHPPLPLRGAEERARRCRPRGRGGADAQRRSRPDSNPTAIAQAERHEEVFATVGSHPTSANEFGDELEAEILRLSEHEKVRAIGETGIDHYRETATRAEQRRAFRGADRDRPRARLPIVIHARDKDGETTATDEVFEILDARGDGAGDPPLLLAPWRVDDAIERGWYCSFSGIVTYPSSDELREAAASCPTSCSWSRPTRPTWRRSRCAASRNEPAHVVDTRAGRRRGPRRHLRGARADGRGQRARALRLVAGVVRLGQNFLADPNLLDAIVRDAGSSRRRRARGRRRRRGADRAAGGRPRTCHAIEIDRGLEPALAPVAALPNVDLHWGDAMKLDLGRSSRRRRRRRQPALLGRDAADPAHDRGLPASAPGR
jgi:TatD DNase family protein